MVDQLPRMDDIEAESKIGDLDSTLPRHPLKLVGFASEYRGPINFDKVRQS